MNRTNVSNVLVIGETTSGTEGLKRLGEIRAHNRSDFPELDPHLRKNFVLTRNDKGNFTISGKRVDEVPDDLKEWAQEDGEVDIVGRLLE
jgi:hypothetical protein